MAERRELRDFYLASEREKDEEKKAHMEMKRTSAVEANLLRIEKR